MTRLSHIVRITCLLVAAAAFALFPAAVGLADDGPSEGSQAEENSRADEHRRDGQEVSAQHRQDDRAADESEDAGGNSQADENRRDGQEVSGQHRRDGRTAAADKDRSQVAAQQAEQGSSDEANRGSIKIHNTEWAGSPPRNEPHPGCDFLISFHGFTAEGATVTFYAWSPTGDQSEISQDSVVFDSQEAQGNETNAVEGFNLEAELAALAAEGFEPHPQQGWHIEVEADATDTVGGAKQKVFWLECLPQEAGFGGEQELQGAQVLSAQILPGPQGEGEDVAAVEVLGVSVEREAPQAAALAQEEEREAPQAAALAQEEAAPGELPLTGGAAAATLIGLGLMITSVGLRRLMR